MSKILITGGSGFIGNALSNLLSENGYEVEHISRTKDNQSPYKTWLWKPDENWIEKDAFENVHAIIHLAGANIGSTPFSEKGKKILFDSRIKTANLLFNTAKEIRMFPEVFISASAIGYYGMNTSDHIHREDDPPGTDFVSELSVKWEASADHFSEYSRVAKIRIGLVLDKNKGALSKMALPIKYWVGACFGNGKQWMPWIHTDDLCSMFLFILKNKNISGTFNGVAPEHVNQKDFMKETAKSLNRSIWLPNIPSFLLRIVMGEKANLLIEGSRISAEKIRSHGFVFEYDRLANALKAIYT